MNAEAVRWQVPAFDAAARAPKPPSLEELEAIEAAARREGFEAGKRDGLAAGQAEIRKLAAQMEAVLAALARPYAKLEDDVIGALEQLSVRIAGALLADAYEADPARLAQVVQTALEALGPGQRDAALHLHPDDARALAPYLPNWPELRVQPDKTLARGDARLHADAVRIDARVEARLQAALAALRSPPGAGA